MILTVEGKQDIQSDTLAIGEHFSYLHSELVRPRSVRLERTEANFKDPPLSLSKWHKKSKIHKQKCSTTHIRRESTRPPYTAQLLSRLIDTQGLPRNVCLTTEIHSRHELSNMGFI